MAKKNKIPIVQKVFEICCASVQQRRIFNKDIFLVNGENFSLSQDDGMELFNNIYAELH